MGYGFDDQDMKGLVHAIALSTCHRKRIRAG